MATTEEQHMLLDKIDELLATPSPDLELRQQAREAAAALRAELPRRMRKPLTLSQLIEQLKLRMSDETKDQPIVVIDSEGYIYDAYYTRINDKRQVVISGVDD